MYRPQDVYINELFGALSQLDDGVTTVHDVSQIHHSPQHSDAAIQALLDSGRRSAFGYFEGAGTVTRQLAYPQDAARIKQRWFSSEDQLLSMIMGGEVYLAAARPSSPGRSGASSVCRSRRTSCRRSASVRSWTLSHRAAAACNQAHSGSGPTISSST